MDTAAAKWCTARGSAPTVGSECIARGSGIAEEEDVRETSMSRPNAAGWNFSAPPRLTRSSRSDPLLWT